MDMSVSDRRKIENEMIFRRKNEKVVDGLDELNSKHVEDGRPELIVGPELVLHFVCECSDENCDARIQLSPEDYKLIHQQRNRFILKPDHQVDEIEKKVRTESTFIVVEKKQLVANPGSTLNATPVDNS